MQGVNVKLYQSPTVMQAILEDRIGSLDARYQSEYMAYLTWLTAVLEGEFDLLPDNEAKFVLIGYRASVWSAKLHMSSQTTEVATLMGMRDARSLLACYGGAAPAMRQAEITLPPVLEEGGCGRRPSGRRSTGDDAK